MCAILLFTPSVLSPHRLGVSKLTRTRQAHSFFPASFLVSLIEWLPIAARSLCLLRERLTVYPTHLVFLSENVDNLRWFASHLYTSSIDQQAEWSCVQECWTYGIDDYFCVAAVVVVAVDVDVGFAVAIAKRTRCALSHSQKDTRQSLEDHARS